MRTNFWFQAAARAHFACPTLEGVELENQGGAGTSSAHFEKHIVQVSSFCDFLKPVRNQAASYQLLMSVH